MPADDDRKRRAKLAAFLRAHRESLQPEDVSLERRVGRRVPGLRRDEVASLAGVSHSWYTKLEQERDIRVGPEVLDAIAGALRLDAEERRYCRRLANLPVPDDAKETDESDPELLGIVHDLSPQAAALMTSSFDLVAWNRTFVELHGDPLQLPERHRNMAWITLMGGQSRVRPEDWMAESIAAILRADASRFPDDTRTEEVVAELSGVHPGFRDAWAHQRVREHVVPTVEFRHPSVGSLDVRLFTFRPLEFSALRLLLFRAANARTYRSFCALNGQ